jgi:general secretion pathway protein F
MESPTLEDFVAWNDQLAALVQAGVPIDVGLGASDAEVTASLKKINATVSRRVHRGESLAEALDDDEAVLPGSYRSMVELGLRTGNWAAALDGSNRLAESVDASRYAIRSSFVYPLIVCSLAFVGLVAFCLYFVPTLEAMYASLQKQPGSGLRVLQSLRNTLPYWIAIPPVILLLVVAKLWQSSVLRIVSSGRPGSWLPGMTRSTYEERCASFAAALATLTENAVPFAEALPLAAGTCGDARFVTAAESLAATLSAGQTPSDNSAAARQFPPYLRWALLHSNETIGRPRALNSAAEIYRQSAQRREERLRIIAPIAICAFLGGGATLLYGLSLFVPVVQLLRTIAS